MLRAALESVSGGGNRSGHIDQAATLTAKGQRCDFEVETFVAHALRGEGFDASEDGTVRGTPIVPVAYAIQERAVSENTNAGPGGVGVQEGVAYTLEARHHVQAVAFSCKDFGADASDEIAPTLRSMGHAGSHANAGGQVAVAFDLRGREGGAQFEGPHDTANLRAASGGSSRSYVAAISRAALETSATRWAVRRLTPRECERLQGFHDDYTLVPTRRGMAADGPRYKQLGNSWAAPVARWIGERIEAELSRMEDEK